MYDVITTIGMFKFNVLLFNNPNIDFSFRYTPCYIQGKRLWVISLVISLVSTPWSVVSKYTSMLCSNLSI